MKMDTNGGVDERDDAKNSSMGSYGQGLNMS
jgi:hypothetical protein